MALSFTFGNVDITALPGIELLFRDVNSYPSRKLTTHKVARADHSITTSAEFSDKIIDLVGNLKGIEGSRSDAESKWQTVLSYLNQREQPLVISRFGQDVQYTATLSRVSDKWTGGLLEWSLGFLCADPVGYDTGSLVLLQSTTITTATSNQIVAVGGSHYASPVIQVVIGSGTGLTNQSVTVKNAEIGQGITVTRTWAAGEILQVDCLNKLVSVNGSFVDYSGAFPKFFPGTRSIGYIDTFTTRNITLSATYVKRYI